MEDRLQDAEASSPPSGADAEWIAASAWRRFGLSGLRAELAGLPRAARLGIAGSWIEDGLRVGLVMRLAPACDHPALIALGRASGQKTGPLPTVAKLYDRVDDAVAAASAARVAMARLAMMSPGLDAFRTAIHAGHQVFAASYGDRATRIDLNRYWVIALGLITGEIACAATDDAAQPSYWAVRSRLRPRDDV